jgi:protein disulfide-isomerase A1
VEGYPTLKVFRGPETVSPYGGQRKADAIVSYMVKQSLPAVSLLTSESLEEFKKQDKVVIVAYHAADDKASNETFTKLAEAQRDNYLFGAVNDAEVAKAEGVKQPGVVLYKDFDEGKTVFDGKFAEDDLADFVKVASTPLVGEVGPETYMAYMDAKIPLAYIFAETEEERAELAKELKPLAEKYKGKVSFATIDAKAFGAHGGNLNLEVGKWPAFAIQEIEKSQKFPYEQGKPITEKEIGTFVEDFVSGKLEPSIKSEPIPETQEGPVTIVVAKNYQDVVIDNDKDVLLEFYAPWCGHCKALAPKYDELAALYATVSDKVTVAKVDATANDVPDDIQGFPTIKLFPAGKKTEPVEYNGSRSVDDFIKFIKENGKHGVDGETFKTEEPAESEKPEQAPAASEEPHDEL